MHLKIQIFINSKQFEKKIEICGKLKIQNSKTYNHFQNSEIQEIINTKPKKKTINQKLKKNNTPKFRTSQI